MSAERIGGMAEDTPKPARMLASAGLVIGDATSARSHQAVGQMKSGRTGMF
jgi:hypothetical protein